MQDREVLDDSREALRRVLATHVPVAAGTDRDTFGHPHGTVPEEFRLMLESEADPM